MNTRILNRRAPASIVTRLPIIVGLTALAGAALTPVPALAQYWGYNSNGAVIALPYQPPYAYGGVYNYEPPAYGYNSALPPGGATTSNFAPQ
jgi:hypothetical protein